MKFPHFLRCLVCFLLIFALVGNAFFTPVNASAVAFSKVAIDSLIVVGSAIMGLGVLAGSDTNAYKTLASSVVSALGLGSVIDVVTWAASGGAYKYAIPQTLVSSIRDYLFSSSVVTEELVTTAKLSAGTVINGTDGTYTLNSGCMAFSYQFGNLSGRTLILVPYAQTNEAASALLSGVTPASTYTAKAGTVYWVPISITSSEASNLGLYTIRNSSTQANAVADFLTGAYEVSPEKTVVTTQEYRLGAVALHSAALSVAYPDWYANSVVVPGSVAGSSGDDDDEVYLPLAPGKTWGETTSGTQEGVWAGAGTWTDDESDAGSGTGTGSSASSISQTWLGQKLDSVVSSISGFFSNVISAINAVPSAFSTWLERLIAGVDSIIDVIISLPGSIGESISSVLTDIFVPSSDYVTTKVEALKARFDWIDPILTYAESFKGELSGATPPVIYVHLQDAEGSYNYGGTVKFLDLTWYSRYKAQGDAILSGFFWALFVWRMYMKLPSIINGVGGDIGSITYGEPKWQQAENREKRRNRP